MSAPLAVLAGRQPELFAEHGGVKTALLGRRAEFDALFEGFSRLRAVSFVVSLETLLAFFDRGFTAIEVVVGENLAESYRRQLAAGAVAAAERLAARVGEGSLRVLLPRRAVHTKLYLLDGADRLRVVQTSANLTETARAGERQVNYAWYVDLPPEHPFARRVEEDYAAHVRQCALFMGDVAGLLRESREEARRALVESWLRGVPEADVEEETRRLLQELAARAMDAGQEELLALKLPDSPAAKRHAERLLGPAGASVAGGEARLLRSGFLRWVERTHGLPLLRVDPRTFELRLATEGRACRLDEELPPPEALAPQLASLEAYFATVDQGRSPDPALAKRNMFEALLALWSAPFAHEFMRLRRRHFGTIDSRGPRSLYIYGPSQNGKSTFLKFALRQMAGRAVEPASGADFGKRKIQAVASVGTSFPLVFDDLVLATRHALFEDVLKSYWEAWWREDRVCPQLAMSSNAHSLPPWAKSRLKRLDFDVHFSPSTAGKIALAASFAAESRVFRWFARLYLERLAAAGPPPEDELAWAREAFAALYRRAGHALPAYFPCRPVEETHDPGRRAWLEALRLKKARLEPDGERALVHFEDDVQFFELKEYEGHLPAQIKSRRLGKTLVVETPGELAVWLDAGEPRGLWGRLGDWLGG